MKGGISSNCSKGRHISILLVALIFTTTLLWAWEKNPLATILPSAKDMFIMPSSSGYLVGAPNHSSLTVNPKEKVDGKDEHSVIKEANGKGNNDFKSADSDAKSTTPRGKERAESSIYSKPMKDCNYAKGRWVESSKRPLYSGFRCKQWLSIMWACRLTKRMDFSFEGYQWQPENCQMPHFDRFTFLKRMQNKTIAFIGDSLGRQQFQSLMCMISGGEDNPEVEDVGKEYDLVKAPGAIRPDGWVYRFPTTNLTVLYYWSASLCDLEPINATDKETNIAMHLDRPPSFMSRFLHRFDILVLNTGHHWNRGKLTANKWVMYKDGRPLEENNYLADIGNAKNFMVYSIVRWVDSQISIRPWLKAFFRTISPRHFFNGDWNTGGTCDNTSPMSGGSEVVQDGSVDSVVEDAVKGTRVKILDVTAISQLRDEGHVSRYSHRGVLNVSDCLHWCLPGIPDAWNEILLAQV